MSNGVASLSSELRRPRPLPPSPSTISARASARSKFSKASRFGAKEGDVISILGASGSGKSTMLRCINMLEVPDSGEIRIGGEAIGSEEDAARAWSRPISARWTASARGSPWCSRASISGPT